MGGPMNGGGGGRGPLPAAAADGGGGGGDADGDASGMLPRIIGLSGVHIEGTETHTTHAY